jgi:hypothetical protein
MPAAESTHFVALPIEQSICMRDKGDSLDNGESIDNYEIQIYSSDTVAQKTTMLKLRESKRKKRASLKIIVENDGAWVPVSFT